MTGPQHPESGQQDRWEAIRSMRDAARQASARQQQEQARQSATFRLQEAARFAEMHTEGAPLLNKRMGQGRTAVLVRFSMPGVLRVIDPMTGRELARSEVGAPRKLAADFAPLAGLVGRDQA